MKRMRKIEELIKKMVRKKNKPDAVIVEKVRKLTVITSMKQQNCIKRTNRGEKGKVEKVEGNAKNIKNEKRV